MTKSKKLFLLFGIVLVAFVLLLFAVPVARKKIQAKECGDTMIALNFAARVWAEDNKTYNNSDLYPTNIASLSNEVGVLRFFLCPSDNSRTVAASWNSLSSSNSTYEIVTSGLHAGDTNHIFLRCKIHGFVGYADGSVYDGKRQIKKW